MRVYLFLIHSYVHLIIVTHGSYVISHNAFCQLFQINPTVTIEIEFYYRLKVSIAFENHQSVAIAFCGMQLPMYVCVYVHKYLHLC